MSSERNCLSHWLPILEKAGLPVPATRIVHTERDLTPLLDGHAPEGWQGFLDALGGAAQEIGLPCFLRTGQGSGKHQWRDTCYLTDLGRLPLHVHNLVEWSALVDFLGLPTNVWAVRELLPTRPVLTCPRYGDFPVCREFRCFVEDNQVRCVHPYWPRRSLEEGFPILTDEWEDQAPRDLPPGFGDLYQALCSADEWEMGAIATLASRAGVALGGAWSIDVLDTERGWFVTDCAVAADSFHWPDCPARRQNHG